MTMLMWLIEERGRSFHLSTIDLSLLIRSMFKKELWNAHNIYPKILKITSGNSKWQITKKISVKTIQMRHKQTFAPINSETVKLIKFLLE